MVHPEVTIIIPNFNCMDFLPKCFSSIRKQFTVDYEVIVVDDGSNDGSVDYLIKTSETWPQLKIMQQHRLGPGAARNLAAQSAAAPLLAFLDADDWWNDNKLASQVNFHQRNPNVGLSFTNYEHIDERTGSNIIECFTYWPEFSDHLQTSKRTAEFELLTNAQSMLLAENVVGTSSVVVSKSAFMAVQGFDTSLPSASDWDLWLKLSKISAVGFSRTCSMFYLQRSGSVSSNFDKRFNAINIILQRNHQDIKEKWPQKLRSAKAARAVARHEMLSRQQKHFHAMLASLSALWLRPSKKLLKMAFKDLMAAATK